MESIRNFIRSLLKGNAVSTRKHFHKAMRSKASEAISAKRKEVAKSLLKDKS